MSKGIIFGCRKEISSICYMAGLNVLKYPRKNTNIPYPQKPIHWIKLTQQGSLKFYRQSFIFWHSLLVFLILPNHNKQLITLVYVWMYDVICMLRSIYLYFYIFEMLPSFQLISARQIWLKKVSMHELVWYLFQVHNRYNENIQNHPDKFIA